VRRIEITFVIRCTVPRAQRELARQIRLAAGKIIDAWQGGVVTKVRGQPLYVVTVKVGMEGSYLDECALVDQIRNGLNPSLYQVLSTEYMREML